MRIAETVVLASLLLAPGLVQADVRRDVLGDWQTEDGEGVIHIDGCGQVMCGVVVGTQSDPADHRVLLDVHGRPQCHLSIINDLRPHADGRLHGTVTNPEDGRVYAAEVWVAQDGRLRLRGYVALEIFGSTQIWPRFRGRIDPDCRFRRG